MSVVPRHLEHLHTWRGLPVPTVALWSSELPDSAWLWRWDPNVDREGLFTPGAPGAGDAILGRMHPGRQRRSAIAVRCQVCDAQLEPGVDAWVVVSQASTLRQVTIDGRDGTATVVIEPWVCPLCLRFALAVCPGLLRRQREDDLVVHRPHTFLPIMATAALSEGPLAEESARVQPALWVKIAVSDGVTLAADEFLALQP